MKKLIVIVLLLAGVVLVTQAFDHQDARETASPATSAEQSPLTGAWVLQDYGWISGFALHSDGTAASIGSHTLLYKTWQVHNNELVLTAISLGNGSASVFEDKFQIATANDNELVLTRNNKRYRYLKTENTTGEMQEISGTINTSFSYFPVDNMSTEKSMQQKHPVDFASNQIPQKQQAAIVKSYADTAVNFAGHYVVVNWGCGSSCLDGVMVDVRDGKIYHLPSLEGYSDIGNGVDHKADSILLVTSHTLSTTNPKDGKPVTETNRYYWLWNEASKQFIRYG
ncbi:lipocalin family protein [Shewanella sp. YIC-542]|uniref:lipocalin family protein n=1 Tax=Shewanella mytili TaxID=3377111 RepID=UPI00398F4663